MHPVLAMVRVVSLASTPDAERWNGGYSSRETHGRQYWKTPTHVRSGLRPNVPAMRQALNPEAPPASGSWLLPPS